MTGKIFDSDDGFNFEKKPEQEKKKSDSPEHTSQQSQKPVTPKPQGLEAMFEEANKVVGDFLVDYFQGKIAGQGGSVYWRPEYEEVIRNCGMRMLNITSSHIGHYDTSTRIQNKIEFRSDISPEGFQKILTDLVQDDYIKQTDLITEIKKYPNGIQDILQYIPEFKKMKKDLLVTESKLTTYHPMVLVMGMKLEYRPLMALAIDYSIKNYGVNHNTSTSKSRTSKSNVSDKFMSASPPTKALVEVAKKYHVKELLPMLQDYKRVMDEYVQEWGY